MLTPLPTAAYLLRRAVPMLPTTTSASFRPIPISSSGSPAARFRSFTRAIAFCISMAQATARCARSGMSCGAPKNTRSASPDDLVDRALIPGDHLHHDLEVAVQQAHHLLRREALRHRREPPQVGHHEGDAPLLAAQLEARRVLDQRAHDLGRQVAAEHPPQETGHLLRLRLLRAERRLRARGGAIVGRGAEGDDEEGGERVAVVEGVHDPRGERDPRRRVDEEVVEADEGRGVEGRQADVPRRGGPGARRTPPPPSPGCRAGTPTPSR